MPHLADVKPFGRHVMPTVDKVGGVPVVLRALLDAGLLHRDVMTVTGRTMGENLAAIDPPDLDGDILRALDNPIHPTGGLTILRGSLAPEGAVVKSAGFDSAAFEGTARVFDGEQGAMDAVSKNDLNAGDVVVIRDEGRAAAGDARDARGHRRDQGRRAGQGRPAAHRRPLLGRDDGSVRRARRSRGRARRSDRVRPGG